LNLTANESAFHPEDRARSLIDKRLGACGWLIQSKEDVNLGAGLGVAVREFQTASGPVDYGLFVGRKLCGVIEAKPEGTTLSGYSAQAARYIADVPKHLVREEGQVRFEYVASGSETLFRDHADPDPVSRRVFAFHRPETLERLLNGASHAARSPSGHAAFHHGWHPNETLHAQRGTFDAGVTWAGP
jgi:type I restriction enzyme R subunit